MSSDKRPDKAFRELGDEELDTVVGGFTQPGDALPNTPENNPNPLPDILPNPGFIN